LAAGEDAAALACAGRAAIAPVDEGGPAEAADRGVRVKDVIIEAQ
jgi:hypothetical protein